MYIRIYTYVSFLFPTHQNVTDRRISRSLEPHVAIAGSKIVIFETRIDFNLQVIQKLGKHVWSLLLHTLNGFKERKHFRFPIKTSIDLRCLKKRGQGSI